VAGKNEPGFAGFAGLAGTVEALVLETACTGRKSDEPQVG